MCDRIRVGLDSTKVLLTEAGKEWFLKAYPKGTVYEYDENIPFDIKAMGADFVEVTCPMGIPYRLPCYIDDKITFNMASPDRKAIFERCVYEDLPDDKVSCFILQSEKNHPKLRYEARPAKSGKLNHKDIWSYLKLGEEP